VQPSGNVIEQVEGETSLVAAMRAYVAGKASTTNRTFS
jgi:hypothetical protein